MVSLHRQEQCPFLLASSRRMAGAGGTIEPLVSSTWPLMAVRRFGRNDQAPQLQIAASKAAGTRVEVPIAHAVELHGARS